MNEVIDDIEVIKDEEKIKETLELMLTYGGMLSVEYPISSNIIHHTGRTSHASVLEKTNKDGIDWYTAKLQRWTSSQIDDFTFTVDAVNSLHIQHKPKSNRKFDEIIITLSTA